MGQIDMTGPQWEGWRRATQEKWRTAMGSRRRTTADVVSAQNILGTSGEYFVHESTSFDTSVLNYEWTKGSGGWERVERSSRGSDLSGGGGDYQPPDMVQEWGELGVSGHPDRSVAAPVPEEEPESDVPTETDRGEVEEIEEEGGEVVGGAGFVDPSGRDNIMKRGPREEEEEGGGDGGVSAGDEPRGSLVETDMPGPIDDNLTSAATMDFLDQEPSMGEGGKQFLSDIAGGDFDVSELQKRIRTRQAGQGLVYGGAPARQETRIVGRFKQGKQIKAAAQLADLTKAEAGTGQKIQSALALTEAYTTDAGNKQLLSTVGSYGKVLSGAQGGLSSIFGLGRLV